jgi:Zn-finger nucleic acid-binding protein
MNCAKCGTELQKKQVGGVDVDRCPACSGIFFDSGELEKILEAEDLEALRNAAGNNEGHDEARTSCPRCGGEGKMVPLTDMKHKGVHIDTCLVCFGQWLDGGELEKLLKRGIFSSAADFFRKLIHG